MNHLQVSLRYLWLCLTALLAVAMSGCSTDDDRDLCCERLTLHYRYVRQGNLDEYRRHVQRMRHFLFDANGRFMRELPPSEGTKQDVRLDRLPQGRYTVITVGNATAANTALSALTERSSSLHEFRLAMTHLLGRNSADETNIHGNGDELFWNARTFTAQARKVQYVICDLSNVHCHLYVKVKWNTIPKKEGNYTLRLTQVPVNYQLEPTLADRMQIYSAGEKPRGESSEQEVIHTFPAYDGGFATHDLTIPLYNLELEGTFTTLRYSNAHIPTLQVLHGNEPITKPLDLSRAFFSWNWLPSQHAEQDYKIELTLYDDGKVILNQWAETTVLDWVDGGSFGVIRP